MLFRSLTKKDDFYKFLKKKVKSPEYETILSGKGLARIYQFLSKSKKKINPEQITKAESTKCNETIFMFIKILFEISNSLAEKYKCQKIYFAGGIIPNIMESSDNYIVIKDENIALKGAAKFIS